MSLVNDLLIETERRRERAARARSPRLDDLVPIRDASGRRSARAGPRRIALGACALLLIAGAAHLGARLAALPGARFEPSFDMRFDMGSSSVLGATPTVGARPRVEADEATRSTRTGTPAPSPAPAPAPAAASLSATRPTGVQAVLVDRVGGAARLRIETDGIARHRLAHDPKSARMELVLEDAALIGATTPIDLVDTPIRSLDLRAEPSDVHVTLMLDREVESRTRWLERPDGAVLLLELASSGATTSEAPAALAPEVEVEVEVESEARGSEPATAAPRLPPPDRIDSPELGDPSSMRIERSRRDREREARSALRESLAARLAEARQARNEGRLEDADARYAEIALVAPDEVAALCEWSEVLERLGRGDEGLALLASARNAAPRDPALLVAQATLLERSGEREAAITLLDQSGLALTEAPEVHALAAALLQRAGRHEAAIERYELVLRRFPEEARGWLGLAISLEAVGRTSEARDVYRIALQVGELPGSTRHWVTGRLSTLGEEER